MHSNVVHDSSIKVADYSIRIYQSFKAEWLNPKWRDSSSHTPHPNPLPHSPMHNILVKSPLIGQAKFMCKSQRKIPQ